MFVQIFSQFQKLVNRFSTAECLLLLAVCFIGFPGQAMADTFTVDYVDAGGTAYPLVSYTVNINKSSYAPNETIQVTSASIDVICANTSDNGIQIGLDGTLSKALPSFGSATLVAPATIFAHNVHVYAEVIRDVSGKIESGTHDIPFTVSGAPAGCVPTQGQSCQSAPNICNLRGTGTIQCGGSCNAVVPSVPPPAGYGTVCPGPANMCGDTFSGTIQCSGSCSATTAPPLPPGYGTACSSAPNACAQTGSGTIQCSGLCNAVTPSDQVGSACSPVCGNGVCESARGETRDNCPLDCNVKYRIF